MKKGNVHSPFMQCKLLFNNKSNGTIDLINKIL